MSWPRPARPFAPIPISALSLFVWWVVAHNSGSGWVQFLGDAAFGILVIGIFAPAVAVARAQVRVLAAPTDSTAGLPVPVQIVSSGRIRLRPIGPPGTPQFIGPSRRQGSDDEIVLLPDHRGVLTAIRMELASAAPFGLQWWSKTLSLPMPTALHVAPRRGSPLPLPELDAHDEGERTRRVRSRAGEPHSVRPYQSGDQRRRVHWPSTAHVGRLMVREVEDPSARPVVITVSLPRDAEQSERIAERGFGTAIQILDRGSTLVMATEEQTGPVVARVQDRLDAGRRLARAVSSGGTPGIDVLP